MTTYDIGDQVLVELDVTDPDGVATDPSTVSIEVTGPDGGAVAASATSVEVGKYRATVVPGAAGLWRYTWTTTGPAGVQHGTFSVAADPPTRLDLLATVADLENRFGALGDNQAHAPFLLHDASALIRAECRPYKFSSVITNDVVVLRPHGSVLRLPDPPVISVASVAALDAAGGPDLPIGSFVFDGIDTIDLADGGFLDSLGVPLYDVGRHTNTYRVTYTHGQLPPDVIVAKVCQIVNRTLGASSKQEGVTQETIGQFTRQWQQSQGSPGPSVVLTERDRRDLARWGYRQTAGSVPMRAM